MGRMHRVDGGIADGRMLHHTEHAGDGPRRVRRADGRHAVPHRIACRPDHGRDRPLEPDQGPRPVRSRPGAVRGAAWWRHDGGSSGEPVHAIGAGSVAATETMRGYGGVIMVDHGGSYMVDLHQRGHRGREAGPARAARPEDRRDRPGGGRPYHAALRDPLPRQGRRSAAVPAGEISEAGPQPCGRVSRSSLARRRRTATSWRRVCGPRPCVPAFRMRRNCSRCNCTFRRRARLPNSLPMSRRTR